MTLGRRLFIGGTLAAGLFGNRAMAFTGGGSMESMYGLIGRMRATPGQRQALIDLLLSGTAEMPGCLSYIVAEDVADADSVWITEVWNSKASHDASLALPAVRGAIARARPLIAGFDSQAETKPLGGVGLAAR